MKINISLSRKTLESETEFKKALMNSFKDFEFSEPEDVKNHGGAKEEPIARNIRRLYEFIVKGKEKAIPVADIYHFTSFAMMIRVYDLDGFRFVISSDNSRLFSYDKELKNKLDRYDRLAFYNMELERNSIRCTEFLDKKTEALLNNFINDLRSLIENVQFVNSVLEFKLYELLYKTVIHSFFSFHKNFLLVKHKDEVIYDVVASEVSMNFHAYHIEKSLTALERSLDGFRKNSEPANVIYKVKEFLRYHITNFIDHDLKERFYYDKAISPYMHLFDAFLDRIKRYNNDKMAGIGGGKTPQEKERALKTDQVILLLQKIGFFSCEGLQNLPEIKKAKITSLVTGRSENSVKTAIEKLEKLSSGSDGRYQKDMDKINSLLNGTE